MNPFSNKPPKPKRSMKNVHVQAEKSASNNLDWGRPQDISSPTPFELGTGHNGHHPQCVMCHMSHFRCQVSHFRCHMSPVTPKP